MDKNLKLVSARIEPETLDKIEAFSKNHFYWKRNAVINSVLTAVFNHFTDGDIYDMVRWYHLRQSNVDCKFDILI